MAQGLDSFGLNTLILNVCMHITTCNIDTGTSMNFIQEYVSIILSIASTYSCLWLPLFGFIIAYVNWMFWFYMPLYRTVIYHHNM
jgi:hypothetical protein